MGTQTFKKIKGRFDYSKYGGAVLLGCKKLVLKAHGSSKAESITNCINQLYNMANGNLLEKITSQLKDSGIEDNE